MSSCSKMFFSTSTGLLRCNSVKGMGIKDRMPFSNREPLLELQKVKDARDVAVTSMRPSRCWPEAG